MAQPLFRAICARPFVAESLNVVACRFYVDAGGLGWLI